jgi:hypothetical protein
MLAGRTGVTRTRQYPRGAFELPATIAGQCHVVVIARSELMHFDFVDLIAAEWRGVRAHREFRPGLGMQCRATGLDDAAVTPGDGHHKFTLACSSVLRPLVVLTLATPTSAPVYAVPCVLAPQTEQ